MSVGPFQFRDVHKDDTDADPFELVGQMFRQVRDIVDQINKSPFSSPSVLRYSVLHIADIPLCAAATNVREFPLYIVPKERPKVIVEGIQLSSQLLADTGIVVTVRARVSTAAASTLGSWDTTTQKTIPAMGVADFVLASEEKLVLVPDTKLTLEITCGANALSAGVLQVNLREVFP